VKNHKTANYLKISLIFVVALCVLVFSFLAVFMDKQSANTINQVGSLYMQSMCEQISNHFETTIDLRLSQVNALMESTTPENVDKLQLWRRMERNAKDCGFTHLALLSRDGNFEMIYGNRIEIVDPAPYLGSLNAGERKVALGLDNEGNYVVLMGVSCNYPMENGQVCTALVAGLPVSYINEALSLNISGAQSYSFIIRKDGSFVLRTDDVIRGNYFDRVLDLYEDAGNKTPEQYLQELKHAIEVEGDYSASLKMSGVRRHMFCTKLSYSEWYLLTFMPYGVLDQTIDNLGSQWIWMVFSSCAIILLALFAVFGLYLRMTWRQLQALEIASREAERASKAKSEFLSNMSHDIRTPMNAIVGMTAIASANLDDTRQVQNCLKKITLSSKHLLGLINDVLDMSKIENGKLTLNMDQVSLREVVDGIVSIVQPQVKEKDQQFDLSVHDIVAENVCCDSVRLNQVILNLLSNAVKFTPNGGSVRMDLYEEPSPKGEDYVRIRLCIQDTGIGMTPEFKAIIFEAFAREDSTRVHKTEGTGLGMAITKYILDAMGGSIEVESEQGKGTTFYVTLDFRKAEVQEEDMVLPSWNMLVVDDDRHLCESTAMCLRSFGVNAEWALDGESAIQMMMERHHRHDDYQIILMDWKLPGIGGVETARRIRACLGGDVPILLISAYDWGEIEKEAQGVGVTGFISKPLFRSTLFHSLKQFADTSYAERAVQEEQSHDFAEKRILLVEDNELNWEIAHDLLSELGLTLEWAENGQICLDKFTAAPAGFYDAVLMDIRMPVMNGFEATRALRAMERPDAKTIPVIAMTADAFAEDVRRCLECGMNAHIAKPIDVREVSCLLAKYL
jgi:signal transduction histidine kinase/CheY-like chemotaxis protein